MSRHSIILLLASVIGLLALGITMLASTTFEVAQEGMEDYVTVWKQLSWLGISLMACGAAAIVTDEQSGFVVPSGRAPALAAAVAAAVARGPIQSQTRITINARVSQQASAELAVERFMKAMPHG